MAKAHSKVDDMVTKYEKVKNALADFDLLINDVIYFHMLIMNDKMPQGHQAIFAFIDRIAPPERP